MRKLAGAIAVVFIQTSTSCLAADASAAAKTPIATALPDAELARITGKFTLPNGAELALSVTSDTVVNGQLILRTVLTIDTSSQLQVFGRSGETPTQVYTGSSGGTAALAPSGVVVTLDRQSGIQTLTPTFSVTRDPNVTVSGATANPEALGLAPVAVVPGGPAIATPDGVVSLQSVPNGSQVTFSGDQLTVINLVGRSIGTAILNSANDRTLDSVTTVALDGRNLAPYQAAMAQMRVDAIALDTARALGR